jgi:hypothetical protein
MRIRGTRRDRVPASMLAFAAAMILCPALLAQSRQNPASQTSTAGPSFDPHDLSGVWEHQGVSESEKVPPMTPWAQAKFDAAKPGFGPRRVPATEGNDPIMICDPEGFPRVMTLENPQPMEFVQVPGRVFQFIEWNHIWRTIWVDGRELPKDANPTWYGYSVGRWDGDIFVVETVGLDDRTWLDPFGDPHSDVLHVEERYQRVSYDTLEFTMKVDDAKAYARPWVIVKKRVLHLNPKYEMQEAICAPSNEKIFDNQVTIPASKPEAPK